MWTIFGAGNLFWDIAYAILSTGAGIKSVVLNRPAPDILNNLPTAKWEDYIPDTTYKIFGFVYPDKSEFLTKLSSLEFNNVIHAKAYVTPDYKTSHGNYFAANSTMASGVSIGSFNYFNRNCSIGHHCTIGDYNHVGPGATICGRVKIGNRCFVGAGSVIRDGITIGDGVTIGAGAVVVKDVAEPGVYIGNPAKLFSKSAYD